ncbi:MAG: helix-turn-helix domain-containing protein [Betaproteobacteria bacterium]|nr:helix-turn-helix domain-containing protein [Betaproteobacteria bacterium]
MPNIAAVFKQEISRLARKEVRHAMLGLRKAAAQYRRDIARLKRDASRLGGEVTRLQRRVNGGAAPALSEAEAERLRFTAKGLQSHRSRLELSAADYGKLIGVTGQTVYKWEHGAARPRKQQLVALAALRGVGKREAGARLEKLGAKAVAPRKARR